MVEGWLISVVDDDCSVRESLPDLLRTFGLTVQAFSSAEEFLDSPIVGRTDCLILDVSMPGMSGTALQLELSGASGEFQSSSSPRTATKDFARACWPQEPWIACRNRSARPS